MKYLERLYETATIKPSYIQNRFYAKTGEPLYIYIDVWYDTIFLYMFVHKCITENIKRFLISI